ncbi:Zinc finger ccch domain-containing protein, partial [Thalictrum thalictroides]
MDSELDIKPSPLVGKDMLLASRKYTKKAKPKKREFIGWGSKPLRDFLKSIDKDSDIQLSGYEVHDIIKKYIMDKKLTDPQKKRKVLCDTNLHAIFGRKTVMLNKTYDLLGRHFRDDMEDSEEDEWNCNSDEKDDDTSTMTHKRQRRTGLSSTVEKEKVLEAPRSCFASVTAQNIKLVYLKRSLIEDLLKNPETFDDKVMKSFVRVRSDPHDYFQKNAYQLLQVTGISKAQGTDNISKEVTLHVPNMKKEFRICMLSDEDFSEEEIVDLRQRVKDGMLERLTIVELEQKARILHEDITEH